MLKSCPLNTEVKFPTLLYVSVVLLASAFSERKFGSSLWQSDLNNQNHNRLHNFHYSSQFIYSQGVHVLISLNVAMSSAEEDVNSKKQPLYTKSKKRQGEDST